MSSFVTRLVLVHGSVGNAEMAWRQVVEPLRKRYEVVLHTRSGYLPRPPEQRIDFEEQAGELATELRAGDHLAGHSYGGVVSLLAAAGNPVLASLTVSEPPAFAVARGNAAVEDFLERFEPFLATNPTPREYAEFFLPLVGSESLLPTELPPPLEQGLRAAMAELLSASAELEAHMRDRFAAVFSATQAAFQECFAELFGGGEARLVLTEPDDLLRTGIEIVARPPGKKLQGLLSLSGGERALTIVSLLFGLLKINPTPFCVLDEVDAALDEANVQRFANLLADFARRIQFIVVTHNRATMDKADALYGVSMDEQGVSHIFSVRPRDVVEGRHESVSVSSS